MELSTFVTLADEAERKELCRLADTKFSYIRKLSSSGKCSPYKAYLIEQATRFIAKRNRKKILDFVPGESLAKDVEKYHAFVLSLPPVARKLGQGEARP